MSRQLFLDLARSGLRMPIATDLVLHEHPDPDGILLDGQALGRVVEETARRYQTPLAFGHMDLSREKAALLSCLGVPPERIPTYHFEECPTPDMIAHLAERLAGRLHPQLQAQVDAVRHIATRTNLVPIGMAIGPFSLMTKLLADPITPIYLAGSGVTGEDDPDVQMVERLLELSTRVVLRTVTAQVEAGARAVFMAEPAANVVYLSPKQMAAGSDIFERCVMAWDRRVKAELDRLGAELVFHCCGELTEHMLRAFTTLHPALLSLGSSRRLWEDAALVPKDIVLYGNLPTKHFYSDAQVSLEEVQQRTCELIHRMREVGHPLILGSECDVLSVPGSERRIKEKVDAFVRCRCD